MATHATPRPAVPGHITGDALYTLDEIRHRLKLCDHAMRQARRAGLKVRRIGRRGYVLGSDIIQFIATASK